MNTPQAPIPQVAIALGSNLGDRRAHIEAALAALRLRDGVEIRGVSSLHETAPVGPPGQGPYLNAAALLSTSRTPSELLELLLRIEREVGRDRAAECERWGPRVIDLDLLYVGDIVLDEPGLTLPHPRMHERHFVLAPLVELAPDWVHPQTGRSTSEMLAALAR